jgi:hypothetical protein
LTKKLSAQKTSVPLIPGWIAGSVAGAAVFYTGFDGRRPKRLGE